MRIFIQLGHSVRSFALGFLDVDTMRYAPTGGRTDHKMGLSGGGTKVLRTDWTAPARRNPTDKITDAVGRTEPPCSP